MLSPRPPITPPPMRGSGPSPAGRALAIGIVLLLIVVAALLYPTFAALNGAIVDAIEGWRDLVGLAFLLFIGLVLASLVRMLFAAGRKMEFKAQQAALTKAPNGMPMHIRDVPAARRHPWRGDGLVAQLLESSLDQHFGVKQAEAQREYPQLHSLHQSIAHAPPMPPTQIEAAVPSQLPQLPDGSSMLMQLHQAGHVCRSGKSLLIGYADRQPQYIELAECGFIGIGGAPRSGKSTAALLLIEQAVLSNWHVFIGDPHIHKADGLLNRCVPFSGRLAKQAVTPDEIATMIRTVDKIGRRRVQGDADRTPVIVIIDEFTNLVWREALPDDVLRILPSMAIEYAGVGVHGMIISHDYSRAGLGSELGAALRRSFTHRIAKRMDAGNVEFLFPKGSSAQARAVAGLETAQALYHGPDGAQTVAVPWLTEDDARAAAQGVPPRPYAPRPALAAGVAQLVPTLRVAQPPIAPATPAPPTMPMNITVPEQILDLLTARSGWMTASEIAAALRVDERVIRTEIKELVDAGQLDRRSCAGRTTKERYEYSRSTSQRVNVSTALSA